MIRLPRLLPTTMAAMIALLGLKSLDVVQVALTRRPPVKLMSAAAAATPTSGTPTSGTPTSRAQQVATPKGSAPAMDVPSGAAPVSDSERALLTALRERRVALDVRTAQIAARDAVLQAAEHRLDARLDQLAALQAKLQGLEDARRQHDEANWASLVKLYEAMKPRDAATIFNDLDMAVLLPVVDRMKESKAAAILAAMDPAHARALTTQLAASRLHANSVGG